MNAGFLHLQCANRPFWPLVSKYTIFEEVRYLISASSQRKLRGYIEFLKFDVTVKKIKKIYASKI